MTEFCHSLVESIFIDFPDMAKSSESDESLAEAVADACGEAGGTPLYAILCLDVTARQAALLQILLVIIFSGEKTGRGNDLRNDRFGEAVRLFQ